MPQATSELRQKMNEYFGDPVSDTGPEEYLRECGWLEDRFLWSPPNRVIIQKEWDCAYFLCDEWDHEIAQAKA